ncbi:MAG: HesA/MoeB/ThiF family protein [Archaeoglobaceae archaeon]|nr:HesA/MoeB/ThiF family protein [Archaeoglobaceae archaeon]MDW8117951.1 HesA/MoeB/ThiF family protein [Archaeoglobaceae archaeon]
MFDLEKYSRQIEIFGVESQKKLLNSSVLVVGAGGLGSAVIQYLASAGIGRLGIVDGDIVEKSNLQRQTIHAGNVGMNKAESAGLFVKKLSPEIQLEIFPFNLSPSNAKKLIERFDVIIGCPDSFRVRYILNDACFLLKKPFIHSAVYAFEGELSTFLGSPCYRCYLPKMSPSNGRAIVGAVAGLFGCLQALEAIKLITGYGELLKGKMIRLDTSTMSFFEFELRKSEKCPVCNGKLGDIFEENYVGDCEIIRFK